MLKKISLLLFISTFSIFSQTNENNIISYNAYIETIKELVPEMKLNASAEANAENELLKNRGVSDVKLDLEAGAIGMYKSFEKYSIIPNANLESDGARVGIGLSSLIPYSGTRWSVKLEHSSYFGDLNVGDINIPVNLPPAMGGGSFNSAINGLSTNNFKYYSPSIKIEIAQPLLRDFFGKLDMYPIKDAEYSLRVARLKRQIDDRSVITSYKKIYYQWIVSEKVMTYYKNMIKEAEVFENQIYRRYQNRLIDNDAYQNAKRQTLQYKSAYDNYQLNLKKIMRNINFFIPLTNIKPDYKDWDESMSNAMNTELEEPPFLDTIQGKMAYELKVRAEYALDAMKNNSLPDLALVGSVSLSAFDRSGYFKSFSAMTNIDYFVGLRFSYPLGGKDSKAKLEMAKNSLYAVSADYERVKKNYEVQIGTYYDQFEIYKKLIENKKEQIKALTSRINTLTQKFDQVRLPIDELISAKLDLVISESELLSLQYNLISALFDYESLMS